jgi:4-amino-4-deoxy-L-arabinose transferase-like glycosyltransferase
MILIIGIPVTILFLLSVRGLAFLEGRLVEALLGERMPRRPAFTDPNLDWIERLKQLLAGKSTWLALLYMALMLPLGAIYFSVAVTLLATSVALVAAPVIELLFEIPVVQLGSRVYHLPVWGIPLFLAGGALLATVTLHLARWVGRIHGKLAKTLLVSD